MICLKIKMLTSYKFKGETLHKDWEYETVCPDERGVKEKDAIRFIKEKLAVEVV